MDDSQAPTPPSTFSTIAEDLVPSLSLNDTCATPELPIIPSHLRQIDDSSTHSRNSTPRHVGGDVSHVLDPPGMRDVVAVPTDTGMIETSLHDSPFPITSTECYNSPFPFSNVSDIDVTSFDFTSSLPTRRTPPLYIRRLKDPYYGHYSAAELESGLLQLPQELREMIFDNVLNVWDLLSIGYINNDGPRRRVHRELSRLSLVCRDWSRILRPKLFHHLKLYSRDHVRFLVDMLYRPKNGWLSAAVTELWLGLPRTNSGHHMGLECVLELLSEKLPSLQTYRFHSPKVTESLGPRSRLTFERYTNLRQLHLEKIKVVSFSLLVKLLGSIPILEMFTCYDVNWIRNDPVEGPPPRMAPFVHLVETRAQRPMSDSTTALWTYLWMFHPMVLRRGASAGITGVDNHDFMMLLALTKVMHSLASELDGVWFAYEPDPTAKQRFHNYIPHSSRKPDSTPVFVCRYMTGLIKIAIMYIVGFRSPTPTNSNHIGSIIYSVEIRLQETRDISNFGSQWEAVDTMFAQKAVGLEHFDVSIDPKAGLREDQVRSHFPRLSKLGIMSVKIEEWL